MEQQQKQLALAMIPSEEVMQAQAEIWRLSYSYIKSMALRCAVKLGIPSAIHDGCGGAATLAQLLAALQLPHTKRTHLSRLMRLLAEQGIFTITKDDDDDDDGEAGGDGVVYRLTPVSRLLVEGGGGACLSQFVTSVVTALSSNLAAYLRLDEWFRISDGGDAAAAAAETPFMMAYGQGFWAAGGCDAERGARFDELMASDSRLVADVVVRECGDVFRGITSLVDVGGGNGTMAAAIAAAFPHLNCSVLDLPQVVVHTTDQQVVDDTIQNQIQFVAGDMMNFISPADAVLLKNVLHDWSDDDCVRILKRCREAISSATAGSTSSAGNKKVVIIEMVVGGSCSTKEAFEAQLLMDMCMMVLNTGRERGEQAWNKIFMDAGFTRYKIRPILGARSLIEVYP